MKKSPDSMIFAAIMHLDQSLFIALHFICHGYVRMGQSKWCNCSATGFSETVHLWKPRKATDSLSENVPIALDVQV